MDRLRATLRWLGASLAVWLVACLAIGLVATEGALHPQRLPLNPEDEARAKNIASQDAAILTDAEIRVTDGVAMRAWFVHPVAPWSNAVILLHGQSDNRAGMLGVADMLLRHGYAVLLPDARAHGASGGAIATYGVKEASDLRNWLDWLERTQSPHCIYGLGDSMGGAQLLNSLPIIPEFCAVVAESPFATFQEAAYDRLGQQFGSGPWLGHTFLRPALTVGVLYARLRYHVSLFDASPQIAVKASHVPVLLIHGLADTNLPPRHSEMIARLNPEVVLWEPVHAEHCGASTAAPEEYEHRVLGWFAMHRQTSLPGVGRQ